MNKKVYTHILFDLDNTLLDFNRASKLAFKTTIRHLDIDYAEDHYNAYKQINKEVWQEYEKGKLSKQGIIKNRWNAIHSLLKIETDPQLTNKYYLDQLVVYSELIDGAAEMLEKMVQKNIKMGLITNGFKDVQKQKIKKLGIRKYFQAIVISDEIGVNKPDIQFFQYTLEKLKNPRPEEVLIVGDNLGSDILGGHQSGLDTCWYNPDKLLNENSFNPTFEVRDYKSILGFT